jgi:hypothetical protein
MLSQSRFTEPVKQAFHDFYSKHVVQCAAGDALIHYHPFIILTIKPISISTPESWRRRFFRNILQTSNASSLALNGQERDPLQLAHS